MKHVFYNLGEVGKARLYKGVKDTVIDFWGTHGNDFKRFNMSNGSSVLIRIETTIHKNRSIAVIISNPKCKDIETVNIIFPDTQIGKKVLYEQTADKLIYELGLVLLEFDWSTKNA